MPLREKLPLAVVWVSYYTDFLNEILRRLIRVALGIDSSPKPFVPISPVSFPYVSPQSPQSSESISTPLLRQGFEPDVGSGDVGSGGGDVGSGDVELQVEGAPVTQKMDQ